MTREDYISKLREVAPYIKENYEVKSMCMFGSTARGTNKPESDVDLLVDMPPKWVLLVRLGRYLENLLGTSVDLVRVRDNLRPFLLNEIKRDGITVF